MVVVCQGGVICHGDCRRSHEIKIIGVRSVHDCGVLELIVGVPTHHHPIRTRIGQMSLGVERDIVV